MMSCVDHARKVDGMGDDDKLTLEELSKKNGAGGEDTFVAVEGKVYDVSASDLWEDGDHMGSHAAGQDLTDAMADAPHGMEVLDDFPQVGKLEE
jgi:predicted heme/steroid binding protein